MEYDIEKILQTYEDDYNPDPRPMAQEPRNMAQGGVIGKPGGLVEDGVTMYGVKETDSGKYRVDAARPGKKISKVLNTKKEADAFLKQFYKDNPTYAEQGIRSPKEEKYFSRVSDEKRNVLDKYAKKNHKGKLYSELDSKDARAIYQKAAGQKFVFNETLVSDPFKPKQKTALKKAFPEIKFEFTLNQKYGVPRNHPQYDELVSFQERGFSEKNKSSFNKIQQNKIIDSHELPEGVKKWDFKNFQYGVSSKDHMNLTKRIDNTINKKPNKIAADFSSPKGWMIHSMNRVYENQIKNSGKSDYKPLYNKEKSKIIGFIDNTTAGKGNAYYGLNKNTPEGAVAWGAHGDFNRVKKFVDISKRTMEAPDKIIQKILDKKGITVNLRLNDILSHDRFYSKLSETAPSELIKKQIVQHHTGGVGSNPLTKAAATKDIQLLTAANNLAAKKYEKILKGTAKNAARKLTAEENTILKNMGAKITGPDGKVYGGGYLDPEKQYSLINKQAKEMVKSDQFNVKTVASYLERLGCGKAAGGRILMSNGGATLTKCGLAGQKKLEKILLKGAANETESSLANGILKAGKGLKNMASLKNLFGPAALAFGAATEAGIVGYDMLATGKTFKEAIGDSLLNYGLGDKTKIDPRKERDKRFRDVGTTEKEMGKIAAFENAIKEIEGLEQIYSAPEKAQTELDKAKKFYNPKIIEQRQKVYDNSRADIQDLNRTGTPDRLMNVDYDAGAKALKQAEDRSSIQKLESRGPQIFGSVFPKAEESRQQKLRDLKSYVNPAHNIFSAEDREAMGGYTYGFNEGGLAGLMKKYHD